MTKTAVAPEVGGDDAALRLRRGRVPLVAGLLCATAGAMDVISALVPADRARLHSLLNLVPATLASASAAATLVSGVLLLLLAPALRRRKVRAWRGVMALLSVSVVLHVLKGLDVEEAVVAAALLVALVRWRDEFYASGDPRSRWRALSAFVALVCASVVLGVVLVLIRSHDLAGPFRIGPVLLHVLLGLVGVGGPLHWKHSAGGLGADDLVGDALSALGGMTATVTCYLVLRPASPLPTVTDEDESRMRELLARHGARDSLGYFALRRDKSVLWSPTGKACIAYRVVTGVMLASGDPLGDPGEWPGAISSFLATAAEHAWVPAVLGCSERAGTAYSRVGMAAFELGDEAVLSVDAFCLEGRAMRNVRQAARRVERAGYTADVRRLRDIPAEERAELGRRAEAWRGSETERGFSMALGRFGDDADADCVVVTAYRDGALSALLHFVPWGTDGLSLDLMRRDRAADNGLNELLIVRTMEQARELGIARLSLNFAVFRSALERGERLGAGPVLRLWRGLLLFGSRWFQIESLYRFNAKFQPQWEPRFVCYQSAGDLPRVAVAALQAEAFVVRPRLARLVGAR